jgi:hypothetical protein
MSRGSGRRAAGRRSEERQTLSWARPYGLADSVVGNRAATNPPLLELCIRRHMIGTSVGDIR